eukprot:12495676-Ditylum_brightwellii.AAC.1
MGGLFCNGSARYVIVGLGSELSGEGNPNAAIVLSGAVPQKKDWRTYWSISAVERISMKYLEGAIWKDISRNQDWGGDYRVVVAKSKDALRYWATVDRTDGIGKVYDVSNGDVGMIWDLKNYRGGAGSFVEKPAVLVRLLYDINHPDARAEIDYMEQQDGTKTTYDDLPRGQAYSPLPRIERINSYKQGDCRSKIPQ